MADPCKRPQQQAPQHPRTRFSELLSWRLLKKNPSGGLIWGILGATIVMDCLFFGRFLCMKEYQVDHKRRMWNERTEMLEKPVRMKIFYPSSESIPKVNQPLIDIYEEMKMMEKIQELLDKYKDKNITVNVNK